MFITYLIGNGFDLGVGLDTRYRDFLKYYLGKESPTAIIKKGKAIIRKQMSRNVETWADMEMALGTLPPLFNNANGHAAFRHLYEDILSELSQYLHQQELRIDFAKCTDLIINDVASAIIHPYAYLQAETAGDVAKSWQTSMEKTLHFAFLSFNYTTVFDRCMALLGNGGLKHEYNSTLYTEYVKPVVHIHGAVNDNMILGVDNESQIVDAGNIHEEFKTILVKPKINMALNRARTLQAEKYINGSQIIVVYGMSIGPTDNKWWELLCEWLQKDDSRYLLVYARKENYDPAIPWHVVSTVNAIKERFCNCSTHRKLQDDVLRRIHVVVNRNLFTLKLVEPRAKAQT